MFIAQCSVNHYDKNSNNQECMYSSKYVFYPSNKVLEKFVNDV